MLFSISRQLAILNENSARHHYDQNKYANIQHELSKAINSTISKAQLDIARIDDRWEKQRQEEAKFKKQVDLFQLELKKAKEKKE